MIIHLHLLRFLPNENRDHTNFVHIIPGPRCKSNLGNLYQRFMSNGTQYLWLKFNDDAGSKACSQPGYAYGTVIHELGHTLGKFSLHKILSLIRPKLFN